MTTTEVIVSEKPFDLSPRTFEQALEFSKYLADSDMVPKDFKGKPGNCLIGMQWGAELGMKPLQALQNIAIINGRPSLWGDAVLALVLSSPLCEYVRESEDSSGTAWCKVKRIGQPEHVGSFSDADAKQAGLMGKQGPWAQYPKRMKKMRARAFALRDVFADVLRGVSVAEEAFDIPTETHMGPADVVASPSTPARPELQPYPQAQFDANVDAWRAAIQAGRNTPERVISMLSSKVIVSEQQKAEIRALAVVAEASPINGQPAATSDDPQ